MSAVESRLQTKDMSETNELLESFETVDEEKDSDEESFHLFLEGDDEQNKLDDKLVDEFEEDTNKENTNSNSGKLKETTDEIDGSDNQECLENLNKQKTDILENPVSSPKNNLSDDNTDVISRSRTVSIDSSKENHDPTLENEDDILNKHVNEYPDEIGSNVEELDPNIEEILLNECDEIGNDGCVLNKLETNQIKLSDSLVKNKPKLLVQVNGVDITDFSKEKDVSGKESNTEKCDENSSSSTPDSEDLLDISMIKDSAQDDADIAEDARQLEQENDDSNSKVLENIDQTEDVSNSGNSDEDGKIETENLQNELTDSEKDKDLDPSIVRENEEELEKSEKAAKRNLTESEVEPSSKRIKLFDSTSQDIEMDSWDITELQSLISFSKFMTKSHLKKLTRTDLEEFCIQKLCEAILHKSELGETNHQLKIQEQTIESLRRDQAVLTKQIKDLVIVNKKLMNEILSSNGVKPVLPVKITRSVGLQVRLPMINDPNAGKRRSLPVPPKTNVPTMPVIAPKPRTPNPTNRVIVTASPQKLSNPLLNKALQVRNRTPVKTPQLKPNVQSKGVVNAPPEKRAKSSGSFIDLTDEDDKKINKNAKSIVPQGVRINNVPKTTVASVLPSVVSTTTPQLMYVVQPNSQLKQGVLTTSAGQKAVLVNFQPTNGVINNLNNTSVSVIPKVTGNIQLKPKPIVQNSLLKMKHPAPLPSPPVIQDSNDKNLKAIPPKPVLSIRKTTTGIILQWRMPYDLGNYETIASYQLYAYQETSAVPSTDMWRKVGDVKAMALPMACTLTQFADKNKYYFAVRPVDVHKRIGKFSHPVLSE